MCEELNSDIGNNVELQKLVCEEQSLTYATVILNTTNDGKEKWRKIKQTARDRYLALLHFDGLNPNAYGDLQVEIHKAYRISGVDALPKRYDRTIFLAGKHDKEKGRNPNAPAPSSAGTRALPGVACAQAGELGEHKILEEHGKGIEALPWHSTGEAKQRCTAESRWCV